MRRWAAARTGGALLALGVAISGCGGERPAAPQRQDWNVVFLLVDTLRSDHLGAYGYGRDSSPILDRFAAANVLFADHRSQAPCTFPSTNSLLTSRSPQVFEGRPKRGFVIPEETPPLAEILRARGYATLAVSASPIVRATPTEFNPLGGYDRGFDLFLERCLWKRAACVNNDTWTYLPLLREPFFLYLHFMDPHAPYDPPDWHPRRFGVGYQGGKKWVRSGNPYPIARMIYDDGPDIELTDADLDHLIGLYDDSIRFFDDQFGMLLDKLEERGVLDRTLIVLLSDHGESFLENGHVSHCRSMYETELRTPLVMKIPSLAAPARVESITSNLDVVPTVLDYLGLLSDPSLPPFESVSLRPAIERGESDHEFVFGAYSRRFSATDGRFKLIVDDVAGTIALYDLVNDPGEQQDVTESHRRDFHRLATALAEWRKSVEPEQVETEPSGEPASVPEGETAEDRLRALGYL